VVAERPDDPSDDPPDDVPDDAGPTDPDRADAAVDPAAVDPAAVDPAAVDPAAVDPAAVDARALAVGRAWSELTDALAATLGVLDDDQFLVLSARGTPRFVQVAVDHEAGLRLEVSAPRLLGDDAPGDDRYEALLADRWLPPTHALDSDADSIDPHGSVNWFVDHRPPVRFDDVARRAVRALRELFGVEHPDDVEYLAAGLDGTEILLPTLGLHHAAEDGTGPAGRRGAAALRQQVYATLQRLLGTEELFIDDDGDIPIREGSAVVFVRVNDDPPFVQLFSPLLVEVPESLALYRRLSELTRGRYLVRFHYFDGTVVVGIDLFAEPFVSDHLGIATALLTGMADDLDSELQAEFGGSVFFGDGPRSKPARGTGGYL
jgi:hypothetical protein